MNLTNLQLTMIIVAVNLVALGAATWFAVGVISRTMNRIGDAADTAQKDAAAAVTEIKGKFGEFAASIDAMLTQVSKTAHLAGVEGNPPPDTPKVAVTLPGRYDGGRHDLEETTNVALRTERGTGTFDEVDTARKEADVAEHDAAAAVATFKGELPANNTDDGEHS